MRKIEIKQKLEELVKELRNSEDSSTLWDKEINESLVNLRKHMTHSGGNPCSCCGGSGVG
ncbi:hypothetical protein [Maribacter stanieri]|uniref:Uncharacterized protein n=1 Tax=Maribacter stanieri TaxID=440514 RepID=A0A1I6IFV1_9FLAO|nr:hypothetical protein [Maribacter stanieri]SFR65200.1 hypothetical protein SAMN04488010_1583 [Maribacter stanieri]